MAELNQMMQHRHEQEQEQEPATPQPARPILASHLLDLEEQQRARFTSSGKSERLTTNCAELDELLGGGGVERGIVVGISVGGSEGSLISLHLLATVLLEAIAHSSAQVTSKRKAVVIDSTGAFPISLLAKVIRSRIQEELSDAAIRSEESGNYGPSTKEGGVNQDEKGVDARVHSCLEMSALCRVFDIEGLWEVLGEVRSNPEVSGQLHGQKLSENSAENITQCQKRQSKEKEIAEKPTEIIDSEDDEDSPINEDLPDTPIETSETDAHSKSDNVESGTEIMIIDSMTHLINDLFSRKEKTDAHNVLSLLSQTLHNLTHTQNILTILHNSTVPLRSSNTSASASTSHPNPRRHQPPPPTYTSPSVFPSNQVKPALGQIFSQFPQLHLFLSDLPKHRTDAELLYGQDDPAPELAIDCRPDVELDPETETPAARKSTTQGSHTNNTQRVTYCTVAEVLKDQTPCLGSNRESERDRDREQQEEQEEHEPEEVSTTRQERETMHTEKREFGWRERRWCALESSADGVRLRGAFAITNPGRERRDNTADAGLAGPTARAFNREVVDSRVGLGVGEIAKVYGFGGRRV